MLSYDELECKIVALERRIAELEARQNQRPPIAHVHDTTILRELRPVTTVPWTEQYPVCGTDGPTGGNWR